MAEYRMKEAAELLKFKSRPKLFEFLRRYGIIGTHYPAPEFIAMGYFKVYNRDIKYNGFIIKTVPQIYVTEQGIKFIKDLHKILTKNLYTSHYVTT